MAVPTKAELQDRVEDLEAQLAASEVGGGSSGPSVQEKIATWVSIATGVRPDPEKILSVNVHQRRVTYSIVGDDRLFGIETKQSNSTELVDAPEHEHSMYKKNEGDKWQICRCGKSEESSI